MTSLAALGPRSPEEINDTVQVIEVVTLYGKAMDRRNWAAYRDVFEDQLDLKYPEWTGYGGQMDADTWVENARAGLIGFTGTQHDITTVTVEFSGGDRAIADANLVARHILTTGEDTEVLTLGGYYRFGLTKRDGRWRIQSLALTMLWDEGDRGLLQKAHALAQAAAPPPS
jgi:hypothetical protein